jgi:hypothetical protein
MDLTEADVAMLVERSARLAEIEALADQGACLVEQDGEALRPHRLIIPRGQRFHSFTTKARR